MINSVSSAVTRRAGRCVRSRQTIPHKNTKSNNSNNNTRTSISSLSTVTTALPLPSNDHHDETHQRQQQHKYQYQNQYQYQYQHKQLCTQTQLQTQLPTQTSMMSIHHRSYSASTKNESATAALAFGAIAATAKAGQYAFRAYDEWQKSQPEEPEPSADDGNTSKADSNAGTGAGTGAGAGAGADAGDSTGTGAKKEGKRENIFSSFFNVGGKYYEGGFEEKMTRREAALILGVRESSTPKRIQAAHRKLLILNHPDTGGSTYISGKINEAKDLLMKGNKGRL